MITSEAMMTICTMIRIELGIWLRIIEMNIDENAVTKVTAMDITKATCNDEVTASAEQMPRTCRVIGLLSTIGSTSSSLLVCAIRFLLL